MLETYMSDPRTTECSRCGCLHETEQPPSSDMPICLACAQGIELEQEVERLKEELNISQEWVEEYRNQIAEQALKEKE